MASYSVTDAVRALGAPMPHDAPPMASRIASGAARTITVRERVVDVMACFKRSVNENPGKTKSEHKVRLGTGEARASGNARAAKLR